MVAVTVPSGRSLIGKIVAAAQQRATASRRPSRFAALAVKARKHMATIAALAAADFGAFQVHVPHLGSAPGWAMVCVSLLAIHYDMES
jgi:hypothetical protein